MDEHLNLRPNQWGYCSEGCPVEEGKEYEMKMIMVKDQRYLFYVGSNIIFNSVIGKRHIQIFQLHTLLR